MKIAFAGNPNSGKTTMFNALTGKHEKVGNWAGVTIGKKESFIKKEYTSVDEKIVAVDLPGAYSMSPFTPEECITSSYVRESAPDVIVNIVDSTNLSRSLFFTTQLLELGIPVVVALNKCDLSKKQGTEINVERLSDELGCPVVETVSINKNGLKKVILEAENKCGKKQAAPYKQSEIDLSDKAAVIAEDRKRFEYVNNIVKKVEKRTSFSNEKNFSDVIDSVLTNKIAGILIFAAVMFGVFWTSQTALGPLIADGLAGIIDGFQKNVTAMLEQNGANPFTIALLADGIIGGVGAVVGFLPLVMVMYFMIALLEDCGYMARVSVVMDPIFKRVGLSGKSIIPIIISTGCGIPGIMASRTIRDERERRATAMLATWIPCGAKIPVIALFAGVFFKNASWVSTLMYFMGIALIFIGALLIKNITGHQYRKSFFIMELPEYKIPSLSRAVMSMLTHAKSYIVKAATIILVCNAAVQIMQTFNWKLELVEEGMESTSILASIASPFAVLLIPLGFGVWQLAAAAVTGFIAKENVVGTLAVVYGVTNFIDTESFELIGGAEQVAQIFGLTSYAALAYLMFNLFTPPCFAAIGAMNAELGSKKWLFGAIGLQMGTGYTIAFLVYQIGTVLAEGHLGKGFVPGAIAILSMGVILAIIVIRANKKLAEDYKLSANKQKAGAAV